MTESRDERLEERMRGALDRVQAPDLWEEASASGRPQRPLPSSSQGKRVATAAFALLVFVGSIAFILNAGGDGATPSPAVEPSDERISVSLLLDKTEGVRCTASVPAVVEPGRPLDLTYTLENVSSAALKVSEFPPSYPTSVKAGDGSTWDTASLMMHSWPYIQPTALDAGATIKVRPTELAVQFPGPLKIMPTCAGEKMPELTVAVYDGGAAPSPDEAVTIAAAATSGLFDDCMPTPDASVLGTIAPPDDAVEPMTVRCGASVNTFGGFAVVTFLITAPADAPAIQIPDGILGAGEVPWPEGPQGEFVVWRFVVTNAEARPVASATTYKKPPAANTYTTEYSVSPAGWTPDGSSLCGGQGSGMGGAGESAHVVFFDVCSPDP